MADINEVLGDVQKEFKSLGDNVKAMKDSTERELAAVRKLAEDAGKSKDNGELKAQLDVLTQAVAEKNAALEAAVKKANDEAKARADEIERKMNRTRLNGGVVEEGVALKAARDFYNTAKAIRGELKAGAPVDDDVDLDGVKAYSRAFGLYARRDDRALSADEIKTMLVGSDPDGGYLVTPAMSPRILSKVYESSPMRELATIETISTDAIEFPIDDGEVSSGWVGEQEDRPVTNTPQVGVQRIPVHELYAMPKATQKLLEDASIDIEAWLAGKIGEHFGRKEATAFVAGTGIKQPRGFTTYASGTSRGQIEQVITGAAATITPDGLINLIYQLKEPYTAGASWLMRRATVASVMLLKDGNGQYMWRPGLQPGQPSVLLGYSVREAADMPAVGAGTLPIAFGNFKVGYTIVDRLGISTLRDPYTAKPFVQFYTRKRVGGDVTTFEAIKLQKVSAS